MSALQGALKTMLQINGGQNKTDDHRNGAYTSHQDSKPDKNDRQTIPRSSCLLLDDYVLSAISLTQL